MSHTPGPWKFDGDEHLVTADRSETLIGQFLEGPGMGHAGEANARLIAAAPELLEALKDMAAGWRYIRRHYGDLSGVGWDRAQRAAEAAIAKAEGGTP